MTIDEKIGQMTQLEKGSVDPQGVADLLLGSVLSGGGGSPTPNDAASWYAMVKAYQDAALGTRLGIPILYGVDAVHGHNNVVGATIFPHQVGLGAAHDPDLVLRIGHATAAEMAATGIRWDFGPVVAVPQDVRWGRAYEGYGEDPTARLDAGDAPSSRASRATTWPADVCRGDGEALRRRRRDGMGLVDDARLFDRPGRRARHGRGDVRRDPPRAIPGSPRRRREDRHGVVLEHRRRQGPRATTTC